MKPTSDRVLVNAGKAAFFAHLSSPLLLTLAAIAAVAGSEAVVAAVDFFLAGGVNPDHLLSGLVASVAMVPASCFLFGRALARSGKRVGEYLPESEQDSRSRLNEAVEVSRLLLWEVNLLDGTLQFDAAMMRFLGLDDADPPRTLGAWIERIHAEDRRAFEESLNTSLQTGEPMFDLEYRIEQRPGQWGWVHTHGRVVERDRSGRAARAVGTTQDISSRKLGEQALRQSEERFRKMIDASPVPYGLTDNRHNITYVNAAFTRTFGYLITDIPSLDDWWLKAYPETAYRHQVIEAWQARVDRARRENTPFEPMEVSIHCKNGGQRTVIIAAVSLLDSFEETQLVTFHDITERKQAEESLRASERRFRDIADASADWIWEVDTEGRYTYASQRVEKVLGYPADELIGHPAFELMPTEDGERLRPLLADHIARCEPFRDVESVALRRDGSAGHFLISGVPIIGADRRAIGFRGIYRDISERKAAEVALQRENLKNATLLQTASDGIHILDRAGNVVQVNSAFCAMSGYSATELAGMNMTQWDERWSPSELTDNIERMMRQGDVFETRLRCRDGRHIQVEINAVGVEIAGHRLLYCAARDISARKAAEAELAEARDVAEAANRAKSQFLANMSHEIRTPLNAILGLAQLLEHDTISPDQRRMVQRIRSAGRSLLTILNDILDFSKIEAGELRLELRPFALEPLLAQVRSLMEPMAAEKGLALRFPNSVIPVGHLRGDSLRLEQVLTNLVGNAIKFTERGEVSLEVQQQRVTDASVRLRFEVRDTGIGIARDYLPKLFTPFTQADGSVTRRFGGTGLGLSISKQLVEGMGGSFGVESNVGVGSLFWFEVPFQETGPDDADAIAGSRSVAAGTPRLSGLRCLVVDDSEMNRDVIARMLQREGANATPAADGEQALAILRAQPRGFDAVMMDIQMPVMDGLAATRAIRSELALSDLPVIAFSAGVLAEQRQQALAAGADDFLAKPVGMDELAAVLSRCTAGSTRREPSAPAPIAGPRYGIREPDLPVIAGIDRTEAAARLGNDRSFFTQMLRKFVTEFGSAAAQTRAALTHGRNVEAVQRLHALRGSAAHLGAAPLAEASQKLETAIVGGQPEAQALLEDFDAQLAALLTGAALWLAEGAESPAALPAAIEPDGIDSLRQALARRDLRALDWFARLRPALEKDMGLQSTESLAEAIHDLRFEEARTLLARMLR